MNVSEMFQILLYLVCCSSQGVVQLNFDVIWGISYENLFFTNVDTLGDFNYLKHFAVIFFPIKTKLTWVI